MLRKRDPLMTETGLVERSFSMSGSAWCRRDLRSRECCPFPCSIGSCISSSAATSRLVIAEGCIMVARGQVEVDSTDGVAMHVRSYFTHPYIITMLPRQLVIIYGPIAANNVASTE